MSSRKTVNSGGLMKCWSYWKNSDTLIVIVTEFSRLSRSTAEVINHLALNNMSINENVGYHITLSARNFSITIGRSRTNNDMETEIWTFQKIWKRITGYNNLNNWVNIHGCFSIFLLNFKPEEGKIRHQTMGIENESFATLTFIAAKISDLDTLLMYLNS